MMSGEMVGSLVGLGMRREQGAPAGMLSICLDTARLNAWMPPRICRYPVNFDLRSVCLVSGSLSAGIRCIGG